MNWIANRREWLLTMAVVTVALGAFTIGNGAALWDRDEPRYAEASRQVFNGHIFVPSFNGYPRYQKPPGIYWVQAASYAALGESEFAARLPSAIFAALTVFLVFRFTRRHTGRTRAGLLAAIAFGGNMMMAIQARAATTDATMLVVTTWAMMLWFELIDRRRSRTLGPPAPTDAAAMEYVPRRRWAGEKAGADAEGDALDHRPQWWRDPWTGFWVLVAVSALIKFPVIAAVMVPTAVMVGFWNWPEVAKLLGLPAERWWRQISGGLIAGAILALAWIIPAAVSDSAYLWRFVGQEIMERAIEPQEGHAGPIVYYLIALVPLYFPWLFLLLLTWPFLRQTSSRRLVQFLVCWAVGPLIFVSLMATKLVHYMLPIFPAMAILTGIALDRAMAAERTLGVPDPPPTGRWGRIIGRWAVAGVFALVAAGSLALPIVTASFGLYAATGPMIVASLIFALGTGVAAWGVVRRRTAFTVASAAVGMLGFCVVVAGWVAPGVDPYKPGRVLRATLTAELGPARHDRALHTFGYDESSLTFYTGMRIMPSAPLTELPSRVNQPGPTFLLIAQHVADSTAPPPSGPLTVQRDGAFVPAPDAVQQAFQNTRRMALVGPVFNYNVSRNRWVYLDLRVVEPADRENP